jgi:hypothetical protein
MTFVGAELANSAGLDVGRYCGVPLSIPQKPKKGTRHPPCTFQVMRGARHYSELTVWQLADELRIETLKLTSRPAFARNLKAQTQAEDAVNSICRNIAEGLRDSWPIRVVPQGLPLLIERTSGRVSRCRAETVCDE